MSEQELMALRAQALASKGVDPLQGLPNGVQMQHAVQGNLNGFMDMGPGQDGFPMQNNFMNAPSCMAPLPNHPSAFHDPLNAEMALN